MRSEGRCVTGVGSGDGGGGDERSGQQGLLVRPFHKEGSESWLAGDQTLHWEEGPVVGF